MLEVVWTAEKQVLKKITNIGCKLLSLWFYNGGVCCEPTKSSVLCIASKLKEAKALLSLVTKENICIMHGPFLIFHSPF